MAWATKEAFFKCPVPRERLTVEGLGEVWVYGLTSGEKDEYESTVVSFNRANRELRMSNARATLLALAVRDQHGRRLFAEADMGRLAKIPAAVVDPILDVARRLSGMTAAEMEDLEKNSQRLQALLSEDSAGGLPDTSDAPSGTSPGSALGS